MGMLSIDGDKIILTRGDTAYIDCELTTTTPDGTVVAYDASDDDAMFTVRTSYSSDEVTFAHEAVVSEDGHTLTAHILPSDTEDLDYGTYVYDFQLTTQSGDVHTPVVGKLRITNEVTRP